MLNTLALRESGLCKPREIELMQATQRSFTLDTCKLRDFARSHNGGINCVELEKVEGRYLITGGGKGDVVIYDTWNWSGTPKHQYGVICSVSEQYKHKFSVESVQWYPFDNGLFTTSGSDKTLKIWDANAMVPAETYEFNGIVYSHHMSTCATEHNLIIVGTSSSQAKLIDMRTGSNIQILKGHSKSVYCVKWSPCLPFIVTTGSLDGRILFWDIRMAKGQMASLDQHNGSKSVGCAHTGQVLAMEYLETGYSLLSYGSDDTVRLWDAFTGKNMLVNYGKVYNDLQRCLKMAVSSGTHEPVLFIPEGEKVKIFDVTSGQSINTLSGHFRQVNCCYYNPFTQEVYSGSNDRNLLVWTPDHEVESRYMEYIEKRIGEPKENSVKLLTHQNGNTSSAQSISSQSQSQNLSSVLADTWSDDDD